MAAPDDAFQGIEINCVAHVILRVNRVAECPLRPTARQASVVDLSTREVLNAQRRTGDASPLPKA